MSAAAIRLLLVEDNEADARLLREYLADVGPARFDVTHARRLSEAVAFLQQSSFEAVLLDLTLPDSATFETVRRMRELALGLPIIVLTGLMDEATGVEAVRQGAQDYLVKGQTSPALLARAIRYSIERHRIEQTLARYRDNLEELVAERTAALAEANVALKQQIIERQRAEVALHLAQRKLMTDREHQHRILARELHDSVGQEMIVLKLALECILTDTRDILPPTSRAAMTTSIERCTTIIREMRSLSHGLYPPSLEALGLVAALHNLADSFPVSSHVGVNVPEPLETARFSGEAEIAIFRIAQEAVHNAIRHSQAQQIEIRLDHNGSEVVLAVIDDGIGFDMADSVGKGLGFISMTERATTAGGTLQIESRPGHTHVEARLPADLRAAAGQRNA